MARNPGFAPIQSRPSKARPTPERTRAAQTGTLNIVLGERGRRRLCFSVGRLVRRAHSTLLWGRGGGGIALGERGRLCFGGYLCTPKVPYSCCRGERWRGERWRGPARGGTDSPAGHSSTAPPKYLPQTSCHFAPRAPSCPRRSRAWQNRHPGKFEPAKMATPQKTRGIKHHPPLSVVSWGAAGAIVMVLSVRF